MSKLLDVHLRSLRAQAEQIADAEQILVDLRAQRDNRISAATRAGGSSRIVGDAAGISHAAVAKILKGIAHPAE